MGAAHLGYDAVSQGNGKGGCVVADRKGIGTDDGARESCVRPLGLTNRSTDKQKA